jgi:hypothetical protein
MSKADEKSKQYKDYREQCGIKDPVMLNEIEEAYFEGYQQAEKDLELTWEDVSKIISIDQQVCGAMGISDYTHNHQQAMEEVLRRFKERK